MEGQSASVVCPDCALSVCEGLDKPGAGGPCTAKIRALSNFVHSNAITGSSEPRHDSKSYSNERVMLTGHSGHLMGLQAAFAAAFVEQLWILELVSPLTKLGTSRQCACLP